MCQHKPVYQTTYCCSVIVILMCCVFVGVIMSISCDWLVSCGSNTLADDSGQALVGGSLSLHGMATCLSMACAQIFLCYSLFYSLCVFQGRTLLAFDPVIIHLTICNIEGIYWTYSWYYFYSWSCSRASFHDGLIVVPVVCLRACTRRACLVCGGSS